MNEENIVETGFEDFEAGLFGDDYHVEAEDKEEKEVETTEEDTEETHDGETDTDDSEETAEETEDSDAEETDEDSEDSGDPDTENETTDDSEEKPQLFTIKVNKKEEQHTLEEMTALAQKGSDYDRVKKQLSQAQTELSELREKREATSQYDSAIAQLEAISRANNTPVADLTMMLRRTVMKQKGMSESEIDATIRAEDAEWKLQNPEVEKPDPNVERYQHDLDELHGKYPDVDIDALSEEEQKSMADDISSGLSMLNAYQNLKNAEKDKALEEAQKTIKDLERKLKAAKKNRDNHYASPGSMSDSGGKLADDGLDDFKKGLFG